MCFKNYYERCRWYHRTTLPRTYYHGPKQDVFWCMRWRREFSPPTISFQLFPKPYWVRE